MSQEKAISAPKSRRQERLEELYRRQVAPLQKLAFLLTGDHHLAEDITQQAFIRFYGSFMKLRNPAAAPAYLRKTVVNLARGHHRRSRRETQKAEPYQETQDVSWGPSVEDHDEMVQAIARLPYRQRVAIVLRYYEDLSEQQAAEVLGCSPGAMKSLTARAMSSLRATPLGRNDES